MTNSKALFDDIFENADGLITDELFYEVVNWAVLNSLSKCNDVNTRYWGTVYAESECAIYATFLVTRDNNGKDSMFLAVKI